MATRKRREKVPYVQDIVQRNLQRTVHWLMAESAYLQAQNLPHLGERLEKAAKEILKMGYPVINDDHDEKFLDGP